MNNRFFLCSLDAHYSVQLNRKPGSRIIRRCNFCNKFIGQNLIIHAQAWECPHCHVIIWDYENKMKISRNI